MFLQSAHIAKSLHNPHWNQSLFWTETIVCGPGSKIECLDSVFWVFECQKDLTRCRNSQNLTKTHRKTQTWFVILRDLCKHYRIIVWFLECQKVPKWTVQVPFLELWTSNRSSNTFADFGVFWLAMIYEWVRSFGQTFWQTVSDAVCTCNQVRTGRKKRRFFHDSGQITIIDVRMPKICVLVRFWTQVTLKFANGPTSENQNNC